MRAFAARGIVAHACAAAKVGRSTVYEWLAQDADFKQRYSVAEEIAADRAEHEAWRRGMVGWNEPVFQGGRRVGLVRKYSDRMLELTLKARRPEKFRERFEHSGPKGGPIPVAGVVAAVPLHELSDAELAVAERLQARIEAGMAHALPAESSSAHAS